MVDLADIDTLVILKPDTFWRHLDGEVEARLGTLRLQTVAQRVLTGNDNLSEQLWREFYLPSIGNRPVVLAGTAKYMAYGPVKIIHFRGPEAVSRVRKLVGATRPWQAEPGTIRGDFWPGAEAVNAGYRPKFQQTPEDQFLFNMIHASDSVESFKREIKFFELKLSSP